MSNAAVIQPSSDAAVENAAALIVDDHPALRRGVGAMLSAEPGLGPIESAASVGEAIEIVRRLRPRVVVLDYHLPDGDGLSLCLRLKREPEPPAALIYSAFADEYLVPLALIAGADALLSKDTDPEELCFTARSLAAGKRLLPSPSRSAMESAASRLESDDLAILGMLAHGTAADEVAETLGIEADWLARRRWAMIERLRGAASRRSAPSAGGPDLR